MPENNVLIVFARNDTHLLNLLQYLMKFLVFVSYTTKNHETTVASKLVISLTCYRYQNSFIVRLEVLWRCWLGGRKGIRPVKNGVPLNEWWGAGVVVCLGRGADLHTAQLMPLPLTVSCFSKIQICFIFLVPAHPGRPLSLNGCVCVFHCQT